MALIYWLMRYGSITYKSGAISLYLRLSDGEDVKFSWSRLLKRIYDVKLVDLATIEPSLILKGARDILSYWGKWGRPGLT